MGYIDTFGGKILGGSKRSLRRLLFSASEPGVTFEPWDITTLFQDRAGTTPVTAAGQSVGIRLDKSQGLRQGPELVTNGDFSAGSTGWVVIGNDATHVVTFSGGTVRFQSDTTTPQLALSQAGVLTVGKTYVVEVTTSAWVSGSIKTDSFGTVVLSSGVGTTRFIIIASTTSLQITRNSTNVDITLDNISVRELAGNHQVAVSDAKRGVYGWMPKTGRRNLLTYTEQFTFAHNSTTDIAYTGSLPTGTLAAREIREVAATNSHFFRIGSPTFNSSYTGALTFKIRVLPQGRTRVQVLPERVGASEWAGSTFNLVNNTATNTVIAGAQTLTSSNVVDAENGWKVITVTYTPTVSITGLLFCLLDDAVSGATAGPSYAGDASKGVAITGMQIGPADTAYQRVASQYEITEAGVPTCYYVQADGVDDAYVTPTITPNTDKVQVFAGVRKLSDSVQILIEHSASVPLNAGSFSLNAGNDNGVLGSISGYSSGGRGSANISPSLKTQIAQSAPDSAVVTITHDIAGDLSTIRRNGVAGTNSVADKGTGDFLAYPAYIYGRGGTTFPFNGLDFGHAVRFGPNLDAATIARVESLIARNTPEVTL